MVLQFFGFYKEALVYGIEHKMSLHFEKIQPDGLPSPHGQPNTMNPPLSRNTLLQRLLQATPTWAAPLERVHWMPGPWLAERDHVYFPEEGLMAFSSTTKPAMPPVLGRHTCWLNAHEDATACGLQTHVLEGGYGQRIRWSDLVEAPEHARAWLLQTAAGSQQLLQQMAQMAYCAQHHSATQRLASWLLICLDQAGSANLQIRAAAVLQGLGASAADAAATAAALQDQGALVLTPGGPDLAADGQLVMKQLKAHKLSPLACSCHLQVALNLGKSHQPAVGLG